MLPPVELADIEPMRTGVSIVREPGSRPEIQIPIQRLGNRLLGSKPLRPKNATAVAIRVDGLQCADASAADELTGEPELASILAALLRPGLVSASVAAHRLQHRLALPHSHRRGLFAVDILAGHSGHDGHGGVPMRWRGDQHRVDILPLEHLPKIRVSAASREIAVPEFLGVVVIHLFGGPFAPIPPDVAHRQHLDVRPARIAARDVGPRAAEQVSPALPANPEESHRHPFARRNRPATAQRRSGDEGGSASVPAETTAA